MLTVMGGMGAVMACVTPLAVTAQLVLGGIRDLWGMIDLGGHEIEVAHDELVFGPARTVVWTYVV